MFGRVVVCVALIAAGSFPASAASIGRDALNRRLLDACVYRQHPVKDVDPMRLVDRCRCAADAVMKSLEGDSFEQPRSGGLSGPQETALRGAIAACFPAPQG